MGFSESHYKKKVCSSIKGAAPRPPVERMGSISLSKGGNPGGRRVDPQKKTELYEFILKYAVE